MATLVGYTSGLFYGLSTRFLFSGYLLGTTVLIILSIYMGPVARQVDYYQAIQYILCSVYITTIIVVSSLCLKFSAFSCLKFTLFLFGLLMAMIKVNIS